MESEGKIEKWKEKKGRKGIKIKAQEEIINKQKRFLYYLYILGLITKDFFLTQCEEVSQIKMFNLKSSKKALLLELSTYIMRYKFKV